MEMTFDMVSVTFSNITHYDGSIEDNFSLSSQISTTIPIGNSLLHIIMSEYGFTKNPISFVFELILHIKEIKTSLKITNSDSVPLDPSKYVLERTELTYEIQDSGDALVTYYMTYRNPNMNSINIEIRIIYFEKLTVDRAYQPYFSENGITVQVENSGDGTLLYVNPIFKEIGGQSSYSAYIRYRVKGLAKKTNNTKVVESLKLIQLPYVQLATIKIKIPRYTGPFGLYVLNIASNVLYDDVYEESDYEIIEWTSSSLRESFYVIDSNRIEFSYSVNLTRLWDWIIPFLLGLSLPIATFGYGRIRRNKRDLMFLRFSGIGKENSRLD